MYQCLTFILLSALTMHTTQARQTPHTPATGSAERSAILDAARGPVEKVLGKQVVFEVDHLNVLNGWAYLEASMQGPGGQPISYADTSFQHAAELGGKSNLYMALLQRHGDTWKVTVDAVGPTDVAWAVWPAQYGAPEAIFPYPQGRRPQEQE